MCIVYVNIYTELLGTLHTGGEKYINMMELQFKSHCSHATERKMHQHPASEKLHCRIVEDCGAVLFVSKEFYVIFSLFTPSCETHHTQQKEKYTRRRKCTGFHC